MRKIEKKIVEQWQLKLVCKKCKKKAIFVLKDENDIPTKGIDGWQLSSGKTETELCPRCYLDSIQKYKFEIPVMIEIDHADMTRLFKDLNMEDRESVFNDIQSDFDGAFLEQYLSDRKPNIAEDVESLRITSMTENGVVCTAITKRKFKEKEISDLVDFLTGGCSDGWGEEFEQQEKRVGNDIAYIKTWWSGLEDYPYPGINLIKNYRRKL